MNQNREEAPFLLSEYAHGAGCGCKLAPAALQEILKTDEPLPFFKDLLVGNDTHDDAAVYKINESQAFISTTDFFTPVVDDAFTFGEIAAANAISDIYAMGGKPVLSIAVLGFPVETLPVFLAREIINGARKKCSEAGIPLAGGHSIDNKEPIFGLSVNGIIHPEKIKKNNTAEKGDLLLLSKPLGTGILSTAQKRKALQPGHYQEWIEQLTRLNKIGAELGAIDGVTAMTDITGFGLLGHLIEMAEASGLSAELFYKKIPVLDAAKEYIKQRMIPDATYRNWNAYSAQVSFNQGVDVMEAFSVLPDPQTNGGLLISVRENALKEVCKLLQINGYSRFTEPIGRFVGKEEKTVSVL